MRNAKTSEMEIQHAILELMLDGKVWSNADLKDRLRDTLPLTGADRSVGARPNEALWENRVNNSLAPARASSLYAKGFVVNCGHGLHQISAEGRSYITEDFSFDLDDMLKEMDAIAKRKRPGV